MPTVRSAGLSVTVEGLSDFRRALKQAEEHSPKELAQALKPVATGLASKAQGRAAGSYVSARAAGTIRGSATATGGAILVGSAAVPWGLGNEFGGGAHGAGHPTSKGGYTTQFKPWRGRAGDAGYAVFPTIAENRGWIEDEVWKGLSSILDPIAK